MDIHSELFDIERRITNTKTMHMLGAIHYKDAKKTILGLDAQLKKLLQALPAEEREMYKFKKENFF